MEEHQTDLKKLAQLAKNRMKNGYWSRVKEQREDGETVAATMSYTSFVRRELQRERKLTPEEAEFLAKVREISESGEEIANPIGRLIDRKKYESLSYEAKQKYILELTEQYHKALETIQKEKEQEI